MEHFMSKQVLSDPRKRLESLLKQSGNDACADCGSPDPKWVSTKFGAFVCIKCSGVHRSLGVHITKVVSVNLDEWTDEQVDLLIQSGGNNAVNQTYEAYVPINFNKPDSNSCIEHRTDFIRRKYELQQFANINDGMSPFDPSSSSVHGESAQDKKQAFCINGNGIKQVIRNSLKWRDVEPAVPKKSTSTAGMVEFVGLLKVTVVKGTNLATRDLLRKTSDPYVILSLGEQTLRTNTIKSNLNPVWNETHMLSIPQHMPPLKLVVYDKDTFSSDDYMGEAHIDLEPLFSATKASHVNMDADSKVTMSVMLQNVERGVLDVELEIIPLNQ